MENVRLQLVSKIIPNRVLDTTLPILPEAIPKQTAIPHKCVGITSTNRDVMTPTVIPGKDKAKIKAVSIRTLFDKNTKSSNEADDIPMQITKTD